MAVVPNTGPRRGRNCGKNENAKTATLGLAAIVTSDARNAAPGVRAGWQADESKRGSEFLVRAGLLLVPEVLVVLEALMALGVLVMLGCWQCRGAGGVGVYMRVADLNVSG